MSFCCSFYKRTPAAFSIQRWHFLAASRASQQKKVRRPAHFFAAKSCDLLLPPRAFESEQLQSEQQTSTAAASADPARWHAAMAQAATAAAATAAAEPTPEPVIPMWIDCDPGHDDAMALMLAGHHPRVKLLGVSTVASNQTVEKTARNAIDVLDLIGLSRISVFAGQAKPLMRASALTCPQIHGDSGLDGPHGGPVLPHSGRHPAPGKGVLAMAEAITAQLGAHPEQGRVQLVATGALTNVALLLLLFPEVAGMVDVTIMGGALGVGNTGSVTEFNIQVDPEAAKVVFESGVPLTMVPLEVTHTALATRDVLARMCSRPGSGASPFLALVQQLLTFFETTYREVFHFASGAPLHDPCAVAAVLAPQLFEFELMRVDIETLSPLSAGQTVCDIWHTSDAPKNCRVARKMDVQGFWELLLDAVDACDAASPMNTRQQQQQQQQGLGEGGGGSAAAAAVVAAAAAIADA